MMQITNIVKLKTTKTTDFHDVSTRLRKPDGTLARCRQLGIVGITLLSYRYAWAERAKTVGYSERFAQEPLGRNSKLCIAPTPNAP
jgi:hypothetical protein